MICNPSRNEELMTNFKKIVKYFLIFLAFLLLLPFDSRKEIYLIIFFSLSLFTLVILPFFYNKSKLYSFNVYLDHHAISKLGQSVYNINFRDKTKYLFFYLKKSLIDLYSDVWNYVTSNPLLVLSYIYLGAKMLAYQYLLLAVPNSAVFKSKGSGAGEDRYFTGLLIADILGTAWDSVHFLDIAKYGYTDVPGHFIGTWVFGPFYPYLISLLSNFLNFINSSPFGFIFDYLGIRIAAGNFYAFSGVLIANAFSFIAMYLFYKITLFYLNKNKTNIKEIRQTKVKATFATAVFLFFPTNFAYMMVAYSESVFVTFCMLSFYFFILAREKSKQGKKTKLMYLSSFCAAIAYLTRIPGGLIFLILGLICAYNVIKYLYRRNWNEFGKAFTDGLKISSFFVIPYIWGIYESSNGIDITILQKAIWDQELKFPLGGYTYFFRPMNINVLPLFEFWGYVLLILILGVSSYKYSWHLTLYSVIFVFLYTSVTGIGAFAIVRYLGTIWPAFIIFSELKSKEGRYIVVGLVLYFFTVGLYDLTRWSLRLFWG